MANQKPNPKVKSDTSKAPASTGASGASGSTQQKPPNATQANSSTTASTGAENVGALYDTSYLNTSAPKNYPIVDQPGGQYKPLSDTSRFVFDKSDALGFDANNLSDLLPPGQTNPTFDGKNASSVFTNRKYFGANKAVVDKLEDVQFAKNYTKPDYIAYLIPYGSPGISSPNSQTVSTQVPGTGEQSGGKGTSAPKTNAQKIREQYPVGYDLFFGANVVLGYEELRRNDNDTPDKIDLLKKQVEKSWYDQINALPSTSENLNIDSILQNIKSVYLEPNYTQFEPDLKFLQLRITDTASVDIKKLQQLLESIKVPGSENNFSISQINKLTVGPPGSKTATIAGKSANPVASPTINPGTTGVDPSLKVWQFLYNPQSITIDVKADYAESNTWGATDDGQSGRSVQWLKNNNPVMRLDEVILNGFIQNKKVGQLEEGLFALLMSRDGPGQFQPTIWEFVWGKRRFGPCVINNIQVVENQWEAGEVLTAKVSFELTQIPKWQIIDSTVKFYDPTAIGSYDENLNTTGGGAPPPPPPGGAGTTSQAGAIDQCQKDFINSLNTLAQNNPAINFLINCRKAYDNDSTYKYLYQLTGGGISGFASDLVQQDKCNKLKNNKVNASWAITKFSQQNDYPKVITSTLQNLLNKVSFCKKEGNYNSNINANGVNNILSSIKNNISDALAYNKLPGASDSFSSGISSSASLVNLQGKNNAFNKIYSDYTNIVFNATQNIFSNKANTLSDLNSIYSNFSSKNGLSFNSSKCNPSSLKNNSSATNIIPECGFYLYTAITKIMNAKNIPIQESLKLLGFAGDGYRLEVQTIQTIPKKVIIILPGSNSDGTIINL